MDVFSYRNRMVSDYGDYVRSFIKIRDARIRTHVEGALEGGLLWPEPLIQLNPNFEPGDSIDELVETGVLHAECRRIFQVGKDAAGSAGKPLRLHRHQSDAIRRLASLTGIDTRRCEAALERQLLASYGSEPNPRTGFPVFAFRLHQFISRGDTAYATVEPELDRHLTIQGQRFVPGDRSRVYLPLVRDAVDYIMDAFPIVKRKDEKTHDGDYRTKRTILDIYDTMQTAIDSGAPYQTRLAPPPADPRVAHPERS